jgi:hypothetical protein
VLYKNRSPYSLNKKYKGDIISNISQLLYLQPLPLSTAELSISCHFGGQLAKVLYKNRSLYSLDKKYKGDIISNISHVLYLPLGRVVRTDNSPKWLMETVGSRSPSTSSGQLAKAAVQYLQPLLSFWIPASCLIVIRQLANLHKKLSVGQLAVSIMAIIFFFGQLARKKTLRYDHPRFVFPLREHKNLICKVWFM